MLSDLLLFYDNRLGSLAKNLFFDLGSGLIQNLRHRDSWYFVGRKGINGFSPIEEVVI
jgi:hypothetical protein